MADRGMSAAVLSEIALSQNQPFHLVEVYFDSGTVYLTDCYKKITWDSNEYNNAGQFLNFSDITEENAVTVGDIELQLTGVERTNMNLILSQDFMDRDVIIRKGFLNSSDAVIVDPIIIYQGKMDEPVITESGDTCTVSVKVANAFVDFLKVNGRYTNQESQQQFFPDDQGFKFAHQVIKEINWGKAGTIGGTGNPTRCFVGNTPITMADGTYKPIESLVIGDVVKSWNEKNGELTQSTITQLIQPIHDDMINISWNHGTNTNTFDHPYWVVGKGWCSYKPTLTTDRYDIGEIKQLEVGDLCLLNKNNTLMETAILSIDENIEERQTYIFSVDKDNTFFANRMLVHNKGHDEPRYRDWIVPTLPIPSIVFVDPGLIYGAGMSISSGGSIATINAINHNLSTTDTVTIADAIAVGEVPATSLNADHTVTVLDANTFTIPISETITESVSFGGGGEYTLNEFLVATLPILTQTTTNLENVVTVALPFTAVEAGDTIEFSGAEATGGIPAANFNDVKHYVKEANTNSVDIEILKTENITAPPIITTSASDTVEVDFANNTFNVGDTFVIAGSDAVGGIVAGDINGTQTITEITENSVSFTADSSASSTARGGGNSVTIDTETPDTSPIETTSSSTTVTLHEGEHGLAVGDTFTLTNILPVASVPVAELNTEHTVASVPNSDSVTFTVTTAANAAATGGGSEGKVTLPVKATSAVTGGGVNARVGFSIGLR